MTQTKAAPRKRTPPKKKVPAPAVAPTVNEAGDPVNEDGLTEVEAAVLGVSWQQVVAEAAAEADCEPTPPESARDSVLAAGGTVEEAEEAYASVVRGQTPSVDVEVPPFLQPEIEAVEATPAGNEPWSGLPEVGLNSAGERSPEWVDPLSLAELQAATNETYAVAIERVAYATEAVFAAAQLHSRTKLKIRTMLRSGEPVTFTGDLPPNIGRRVDADSSGKLGQSLRQMSEALNSW